MDGVRDGVTGGMALGVAGGRGCGVGTAAAPPPPGFTLVEVLVALVVLEVGLLGAVGMTALAAGTMARAAERQRAVGSLEVVADSLLRYGVGGVGEREMGHHRIRWSTTGSVTTVLALRVREDGSDGEVLLAVGMARP